jgi:glycosyltransferase involved in cell wall biosynthesis
VLADLVARLDRDRFLPVVATPAHSALVEPMGARGVTVAPVAQPRLRPPRPASALDLVRSVRDVARIVRRLDVTLIHSNTTRSHILASLAGPLTVVPVVWTLHDRTLPPAAYRLLSRVPTRIITVSDDLRDHYRTPATAARLVTIRNGMPAAAPPADDGTVRRRLGIPADAPLILHVGRLVESKGAHVFVRAAARAQGSIDGAHFVVVGGPDRNDPRSEAYAAGLARLVRRIDGGARIRLVGHQDDVGSHYATADVFAYTAVAAEGLPTVLLEAMHHGVPVIASATGGASEIVPDGSTGWLVPPGDEVALAEAMIALSTDPGARARAAAAARERIGTGYSLQHQVDRLHCLYAEVLARHEDR